MSCSLVSFLRGSCCPERMVKLFVSFPCPKGNKGGREDKEEKTRRKKNYSRKGRGDNMATGEEETMAEKKIKRKNRTKATWKLRKRSIRRK